ncbi:MAG: ricin-type beta-trefoil lectin domain protein [Alphaproteobacteria bacterium]
MKFAARFFPFSACADRHLLGCHATKFGVSIRKLLLLTAVFSVVLNGSVLASHQNGFSDEPVKNLETSNKEEKSAFMLVAGKGGWCLGLEGGKVNTASNVIIEPCQISISQLFIEENGRLHTKKTGVDGASLCLEAQGGLEDGNFIRLNPCDENSAIQRFSLVGSQLRAGNNLCIKPAEKNVGWKNHPKAVLANCSRDEFLIFYPARIMHSARVEGNNGIQSGQLNTVVPFSGDAFSYNTIKMGSATPIFLGNGQTAVPFMAR